METAVVESSVERNQSNTPSQGSAFDGLTMPGEAVIGRLDEIGTAELNSVEEIHNSGNPCQSGGHCGNTWGCK